MPSYETPDMNIPLDKRDSKVDIPVFANVRVNFSKSKVTPFIDAKGGTYVTNNGGLYVNGSAGIRIACNGKQAINIMVGYTTEELEFETFWKFNSTHSMSYTRKPAKYGTDGVSLKIGYEF
jgi:adenosylmethionine-8-amino-7-oxononanoate aminotransferase